MEYITRVNIISDKEKKSYRGQAYLADKKTKVFTKFFSKRSNQESPEKQVNYNDGWIFQ